MRVQQDKQKNKFILNSRPRRWNPPPHGRVKINIDVVVFPETSYFDIWSVIRDEQGEFTKVIGQRITVNI